ncbi:hypothetical protein ACFL96_01095 [Thermoproteota archaeon]
MLIYKVMSWVDYDYRGIMREDSYEEDYLDIPPIEFSGYTNYQPDMHGQPAPSAPEIDWESDMFTGQGVYYPDLSLLNENLPPEFKPSAPLMKHPKALYPYPSESFRPAAGVGCSMPAGITRMEPPKPADAGLPRTVDIKAKFPCGMVCFKPGSGLIPKKYKGMEKEYLERLEFLLANQKRAGYVFETNRPEYEKDPFAYRIAFKKAMNCYGQAVAMLYHLIFMERPETKLSKKGVKFAHKMKGKANREAYLNRKCDQYASLGQLIHKLTNAIVQFTQNPSYNTLFKHAFESLEIASKYNPDNAMILVFLGDLNKDIARAYSARLVQIYFDEGKDKERKELKFKALEFYKKSIDCYMEVNTKMEKKQPKTDEENAAKCRLIQGANNNIAFMQKEAQNLMAMSVE